MVILNLKFLKKLETKKTLTLAKRSGFTLVETVIFLGVVGIFFLLILSLLNNFLKTRNRIVKLATLQETTGYIFNQLTQEIHWSDQKPDIHQSGPHLNRLELIQTENQQKVVFRVQNDRLLKEIIPQTGSPTSEPISHPQVQIKSFQVLDRSPEENQISCLKIQLELEYAGSTPKIIAESHTTISLRKTKFESSEE